MQQAQPIGIFDSGYGGLTVLKDIMAKMPGYDYLYLGDNARAPYGSRSFETVYRYTLECVTWFFNQGCPLVVLACNTASAKALRTIQQHDLPSLAPGKRVLGVIRPTTEVIGTFTKTNNVGILATSGTVLSGSYPIEIEKFFPGLNVFQEACPLWVPLIEANEFDKPGADYFVRQHINNIFSKSGKIDTLLLACTHYPVLKNKIEKLLPKGVTLLWQGEIVARSLVDYLHRHPEMDEQCSKNGRQTFFTTDSTEDFDNHASTFFGKAVLSKHLDLEKPV
jgi:glutamate racemase